MATIKRWSILNAIKTNLQTIRKGQAVGGSVADAYSTSVGLVTYGSIDLTNLSADELPAVMIIADLGTTFGEPDGNGYTYQATWPIALTMVVRDDQRPGSRENDITHKLEEFFRDVDMAMHRDENLYGSADVSLTLRSYDPETIVAEETTFGAAVAVYEITYEHTSF